LAAFLSSTENRPGLKLVLRCFIRVASSGGIVTGLGEKGKGKTSFREASFVKREAGLELIKDN